jgi:hypothetical protein
MGVLALLISPVWLFSHEGFRVPTLIGGGVFVVAVFVGTLIGMPVRTTAFHRLAARSAPLVLAIRAYDTKYGQPPPDLAALVPEYFPSVPGTGMGAYPNYRYLVGKPAASYAGNPWVLVVSPNYRYLVGKPAASYAGNPWVLVVSTPSGGINFDCFLYFPLQNYPETGYGGWLERMAGWAYVHE